MGPVVKVDIAQTIVVHFFDDCLNRFEGTLKKDKKACIDEKEFNLFLFSEPRSTKVRTRQPPPPPQIWKLLQSQFTTANKSACARARAQMQSHLKNNLLQFYKHCKFSSFVDLHVKSFVIDNFTSSVILRTL
jgi:hypothetical protein